MSWCLLNPHPPTLKMPPIGSAAWRGVGLSARRLRGGVTSPRYPGRMGARSRVRTARVYDDPSDDDGQRVLVDRLWPRGFRKDDPRVGTWLKDVAPSKELRDWYHHEPERFEGFVARYREELQDNAALEELRKLTKSGVVTLVTATRHIEGSHAAVLATLLR